MKTNHQKISLLESEKREKVNTKTTVKNKRNIKVTPNILFRVSISSDKI